MADECTQCDETRQERDEAIRERNEERLMKLHALAKLHARGPALAIGSEDFTWMVEQIYKLGDEVATLRVKPETPGGYTLKAVCTFCLHDIELHVFEPGDGGYVIDITSVNCSRCLEMAIESLDEHLRM